MFCQVEPEQVVAVHDVSSTYHVPLLLEQQGLVALLTKILRLDALTIAPSLTKRGTATWTAWKALTSSPDHHFPDVTIALVGKYTNLHDSYLSVIKSLEHAAMACARKLKLVWVDASHLEDDASRASPADFHKAWHEVCTAQGILVPGGFGHRGTEGMIAAARWARTHRTPYLGICLGMQLAVIEFARNVCGIAGAASEELAKGTATGAGAGGLEKVVMYMPEIDRGTMGGNMRLGIRPTHFQPGSEWSKLRALYRASAPPPLTNGVPAAHPAKQTIAPEASSHATPSTPSASTAADPIILERHRHRYEVNPEYIERLAKAGLTFVGRDDKGERMEVLELRDHPWFVGVQFHPEYLSRVLEPSRPYLGFVAASAGCLSDAMANIGERTRRRAESAVSPVGMRPETLANGLSDVVI